MATSYDSPRFLDAVVILVNNSNHAAIKRESHKLMLFTELFNSVKFPVDTVCWPPHENE